MRQDEVRILLDNFEREMKRLRMEYNRYLANAADVNIEFCEKRVNDLIKLLQKTTFKKYIHKFRFDNLLARYNVMRINFGRLAGIKEKKLNEVKERLGLKEEGLPAGGSTGAGRERMNALQLSDPDLQGTDMERFYSRYVEMKTIHEGMVTLSYDEFSRKLTGRVERVKLEGKGREIQVRLVEEDGKVKIKTKVVK